jgi:cephalosporin hydroxylase
MIAPSKRWNDLEAESKSKEAKTVSKQMMNLMTDNGYPYNFDWLGVPIIQCPQDIIALQEIIWKTKPTLIIETGVAHGGSLIFYASMLKLLSNEGRVIGVDIDIRAHNRSVIESHFLASSISLIQGSSISDDVIGNIKAAIKPTDKIMVVLDSNHTHEHVLQELKLYSQFITKGMYMIVMDTAIEDVEDKTLGDRPWGPGNSPKTAVHEFLKESDRFVIDKLTHDKLLISVAPDGYLKCVK